MTRNFDVAAAFRRKQSTLLDSHASIRDVTSHPTTVGSNCEADWSGELRGFLPERYVVGPIFAVDADGATSEQIDVAVYDRQYSPLWFGSQAGADFVPVEAVYAVFEVKPTINTTYITAARQNVASVRRLRRTSAPIKHAAGTYGALDPSSKHVIGGLLAAEASWSDREATIAKLQEHLPSVGLDDSWGAWDREECRPPGGAPAISSDREDPLGSSLWTVDAGIPTIGSVALVQAGRWHLPSGGWRSI